MLTNNTHGHKATTIVLVTEIAIFVDFFRKDFLFEKIEHEIHSGWTF